MTSEVLVAKSSKLFLLIVWVFFAVGCSTQGEVQNLNLAQDGTSVPDNGGLPGDGGIGGGTGGGGGGSTFDPTRLRLDPPSLVIGAGKSAVFSSLNGTEPYSYSIYLGDGSVVSSTGAFTAPAQAGNSILRVKDAAGKTAYANIQITESPKIFPAQVSLAQGNVYNFSVVGGRSPYTFSLVTGQGVIDAVTGQFRAPTINGATTVRVTDQSGNTSDAIVNVNASLSISPAAVTLPIGTQTQFSVVGGVGQVTYSVAANEGLIDPSTGEYMAPNKVGAYAVRAQDALGNSITATVTVVNAVEANPKKITLNVSGSFSFAATGGKAPYFYTAVNGSMDTNTGLYTAPATTGTDTITVKDATGATSTAEVVVVSNGALTIANTVLTQGSSGTLSVQGAGFPLASCVFSPAADGTCNLANGNYVAPSTPGIYTVAIVDANGKSATTTIVVNEPLDLTPANSTLAVGSSVRFAGKGGVPPYTYSLLSGDGSVNGSTGEYFAANFSGGATVKVTDSKANSKTTNLTVVAKVALTPPSFTLSVGQTQKFTATGGVAPYTYQVDRGTIDASGNYTAPLSAGNAIVRAQDALGNVSQATVVVQDGMVILPQQVSLVKNSSIKFDVVSGNAPFVFSVQSGGGTIDNQGYYQAGDNVGEVVIKVIDANNLERTANVSVVDNVTISPFYKIVSQGSSIQLTASGGVAPYTFTLESGGPGGSLTSQSGNVIVFNAPNTDGYQGVKVTDAVGGFATGYLIVQKPLGLAIDRNPISVGNQATLTASGGVPPYTFTVDPLSAGDVTKTASNKADFVAGADPQSVTMRVTDAEGTVALQAVTIAGPLSVSPTGLVLVPNQSKNIAVSGGVPPYTARVVSGGGSFTTVDANTFAYQAPNAGSSVQMEITDGLGNKVNLSASVFPSLLIQPSNPFVGPSQAQVFTITGGSGTFAFALNPSSGKGTFVAGTKTYTAPATVPATQPQATLTVTDSLLSVSASTVITIRDAVSVDLVTSSTADGLYGIGQSVNAIVKFKETVIVDSRNGVPFLELKFGSTIRNASYVSGSGSAFLTFQYTLAENDTTADLNYNATTSLKLNGGTIKDSIGMNAVLTLPATNDATKSLAGPKAIQTDGSRPVAVLTGAPSNYGNQANPQITVGGSGVTHYKYKYGVASTTDCAASAGYGAEAAVAGNISLTLTSMDDGPLKLCVLGKNAAGNWQLESAATLATWTQDSVAPAAPTNLNDGLNTQDGSTSPMATWTASPEDSLSGIAFYEMAIGTTAGGTEKQNWTSVGKVVTANASSLTLTTGVSYYTSLRAVDGAGNRSSVVVGDGWLNQGAVCPAGFVFVPEDTALGVKGFCVAKYEMKNVAGTAVSQAAGTPWTQVNKGEAVKACRLIGMDLMTNEQWKVVTKNIIGQASNWSGGAVNSGYLARGHSDNSPASLLAASTDGDPYNGTEQNSSMAFNAGGEQKRTHVLSNGAVIWDLAGNAGEILNDEISGASFTPVLSTAAWSSLRDNTLFALGSANVDFWNMGFRFDPILGAGKFFGGTTYSVTRGGDYKMGDSAGLLSTYLASNNRWAFATDVVKSFRCSTRTMEVQIGACGNYVNINSNTTVSVKGGVPPFTYELISGGGTMASNGVFTAPATIQDSVIKVTDSVGTVRTETVRTTDPNASIAGNSSSGDVIFNYTGADQDFVVPAGVNTITVRVWGASGASYDNSPRYFGGSGAYLRFSIPVNEGEQYKVVVGQGGGTFTTDGSKQFGGGFSGLFKPDLSAIAISGGGGSGHIWTYGGQMPGAGLIAGGGRFDNGGSNLGGESGNQDIPGVGARTTQPGVYENSGFHYKEYFSVRSTRNIFRYGGGLLPVYNPSYGYGVGGGGGYYGGGGGAGLASSGAGSSCLPINYYGVAGPNNGVSAENTDPFWSTGIGGITAGGQTGHGRVVISY